ncbi:MAG: ketol-acid reductoisomerase [Candidatus Zixiibacteriota bacterium]
MKKMMSVAVLGYGSQGRAIAQNLRDSGFTVTVGLRPKSVSRKQAKKDQIASVSIPDAVKHASAIIVALPDHVHAAVLNEAFFTDIKNDPALVFLHGSSIHFRQVEPPKGSPILLLAPHAPGLAVRDNFLKKEPYSAFYAVYSGNVKKGTELVVSLAQGIGIPKSHLVKTTFADEAIGDLFGEQAVLCGGLARLLKYGFETLVEGGLPKQNAYLEVAYQIDLIVSLVKTYGLDGMFNRISPMARYGSIVNGPQVIGPNVKREMKAVLNEITSGGFIARADKTRLAYTKKQYQQLTSADFDRQAKKFKPK